MKSEIKTGKSGIKIDPANKGKFTELKKRTGKSTEELKHSKNPLTRKRATFAANAKKWKHQQGGNLQNPILKDQQNQDYLNNPLNPERLKKNIGNLLSSLKLPGIAAATTAAAVPGIAMMGYGLASNIIGGAAAGSMGLLTPIVGNAFLSNKQPDNKDTFQMYKEKNTMNTPSQINSWLNSIEKKQFEGILNYDISNILSQWKK